MICLLLMTDGRDVLERTIASALSHLRGPVTRFVIHTDADDVAQLSSAWPDWEIIGGERRGFAGAIDRAWREISKGSERYVFHLEDDFTFNRPLALVELAHVLDAHPYLVQMALRRQPWNEAERRAGGIVEQWPHEYFDQEWRGYEWLEHRLFFTTNPSLVPTRRCFAGWPVVPQSERAYSEQTFSSPDLKSAFWGPRFQEPWVTHIGQVRIGTGY
jgi:hypothetical protein